MWLVMIVSGFVADLLRRKHILRTTTVRKLCNTIGKSSPVVSCSLVAVQFSPTSIRSKLLETCLKPGFDQLFDKSADFVRFTTRSLTKPRTFYLSVEFLQKVCGLVADLLDLSRHVEIDLAALPMPPNVFSLFSTC